MSGGGPGAEPGERTSPHPLERLCYFCHDHFVVIQGSEASAAAAARGPGGAATRLARVLDVPGLAGWVFTATSSRKVEPVLPVADELARLLPWQGLRRGAAVQVTSSTALLISLVAQASTPGGGWLAFVGMPNLGLLATREAGVDLDRILLVPDVDAESWTRALDVLAEGLDVVVVAPPVARIAPRLAKRIAAKSRQTALVSFGETTWPGAEAVLSPVSSTWYGIGKGHGRLRHQRLEVRSVGPGALARGRSATLYPHGHPDPRDVAAAEAGPGLRAVA